MSTAAAAPSASTTSTMVNDAVQAPHQYRMVRKLHDTEDIWLVEREADNHQFVAFRWNVDQQNPQLSNLLERGAGDAVAAVLNHPNLVSHIDLHQAEFWTGQESEKQNYALCDYCDAGTLRNFLDKTPVLPVTKLGTREVLQWLPESLVWHVATSLLSALAWLHEGVRLEDSLDWQTDGSAERGTVQQSPFDRGEDWFPLLHRDIRAEHVFFQHPKGIETYGYCKLGGFGSISVSGHAHGRAVGTALWSEAERTSELDLKTIVRRAEASTVLARRQAENEHIAAGTETEEREIWIDNYDHLVKGDRPYFKGNEAFKVGEILYLMMTRQVIPDPEECPGQIPTPLSMGTETRECGVRHWDTSTNTPGCPIWPMGTFRLTEKLRPLIREFDPEQPKAGYSPELVDLVSRLLGSYRQTVDTTQLLAIARSEYEEWKEETEEGQRHVDHWDDMLQRETNRRKKEAAEMATAIRQSGPRAQEYLKRPIGGARARARAGAQ